MEWVTTTWPAAAARCGAVCRSTDVTCTLSRSHQHRSTAIRKTTQTVHLRQSSMSPTPLSRSCFGPCCSYTILPRAILDPAGLCIRLPYEVLQHVCHRFCVLPVAACPWSGSDASGGGISGADAADSIGAPSSASTLAYILRCRPRRLAPGLPLWTAPPSTKHQVIEVVALRHSVIRLPFHAREP